MADTNLKLDRIALSEISDDDEEVVLVTAAAKTSLTTPVTNRKNTSDDEDQENPPKEANLVLGTGLESGGSDEAQRSEAQAAGMMVLSLLDKIIGVVDQIQLTQNSLESRQENMEKSVTSITSELNKLTKNHVSTAHTVNKLLDKVRKVNTNVKGVRADLDKQVGQIKKLENNEHELLKRKNFKVLIYQDKEKQVKTTKKAASEEGEQVLSEGGEEERGEDEEVEIEETVEESRAARIKRSGMQRVDVIKKAFSKEQMEKTRQRTKENLEKTRQRTKENLEKTRLRTRENFQKTRLSLGKKMGKLGTKMAPSTERKEKLRVSRDKLKKSLTQKSANHAKRPKITTYRVPPFTFYVKKVREGEVEPEPEAEPEEEEEVEEEEQPEQEQAQEYEDEEEEEVEEGQLVNLSPEMEVVLGESRLVVQDRVRPGERASH
ncbi:caveolae-associated protein 1 [Astyanax mexicanus]|uniref:Caveolae-associated protein 1 n=1 Tax=Astyanax mexicanus TaxID=7994 RepID=A0A8B9LDV3_ASTMX|nr:caveolae-associated protein 1 [Astyanax mexicanus]